MKKILFFAGIQLFSVVVFAQIQGDVTDQNEKAVPNVLIVAVDSSRAVIDTVKSDNRGFFSFNRLSPGKYVIQAKAPGYKPVIFQNIIVKEGETGIILGGDLYSGQRLNITLTAAKSP